MESVITSRKSIIPLHLSFMGLRTSWAAGWAHGSFSAAPPPARGVTFYWSRFA
jgi:hypothetical protein